MITLAFWPIMDGVRLFQGEEAPCEGGTAGGHCHCTRRLYAWSRDARGS